MKAFVSDFDDDGDDEEVEDGRGSFDRALVWWSLSRSDNKRKSSDEAVLDRALMRERLIKHLRQPAVHSIFRSSGGPQLELALGTAR